MNPNEIYELKSAIDQLAHSEQIIRNVESTLRQILDHDSFNPDRKTKLWVIWSVEEIEKHWRMYHESK